VLELAATGLCGELWQFVTASALWRWQAVLTIVEHGPCNKKLLVMQATVGSPVRG
jgi:hypothetical protein